MKTITNKTLLKRGDKTYQPIEVGGVIYWYEEDDFKKLYPKAQSRPFFDSVPIINLDSYIQNLILTDCFGTKQNKEIDLKQLTHNDLRAIIQNTIGNYSEIIKKDIGKAFQLGVDMCTKYHTPDNGIDYDLVEGSMKKELEQINHISVIEVDEEFDIIGYE